MNTTDIYDGEEEDDGSLTICLPQIDEAASMIDNNTQTNHESSEPTLFSSTSEEDGTEPIEVGIFTTKRFNFLVAGANGSGKTTFALSALSRYFPSFRMKHHSSEDQLHGPTKHIEERGRCEKMQGSTRVIVTIVDTPGYGDQMNNVDRISSVIDYIQTQNRLYEEREEYRRFNNQENDTRIHGCFYFIMPHRVTPLDLDFMYRLQSKTPVIPIVAKTDTMKISELEWQLAKIHTSLEEKAIQVFDFGETDIDETWLNTAPSSWEQEDLLETKQVELSESSPYSRIGQSLHESAAGSTTTTVSPRRQIRNVFCVISGKREYPWGIADEHNPLHSDTPRLHRVLFKDRTLASLGRLQEHANQMHETWRHAQVAHRKQQLQQEAALQQHKRAKQQAWRAQQQYQYVQTLLVLVTFGCVWWISVYARFKEEYRVVTICGWAVVEVVTVVVIGLHLFPHLRFPAVRVTANGGTAPTRRRLPRSSPQRKEEVVSKTSETSE